MSYRPAEAREWINRTYYETWKDPAKGWQSLADALGNPIILSKEPRLEWENDEADDPPEITEPVVYINVRHYSSPPSTIGGETRKINTRKGFVLIRVWVPTDAGLKTADALSYIAKIAFERKRGFGGGSGIVFRSWRPTEAGPQKGRFLTVSTVDFEYDELTGV